MGARIYNTAELEDGQLGRTAVAIGSFDGVHMGHRVICQALIEKAHSLGVSSVAYTFDPHPRKVLQGPHATHLLTSFEKKCELLGSVGIDIVVWSEFTREFSEQTPAEFISRYLVGKLAIRHIFVGYDSHFAHNREGNFNTLVEMSQRFGFDVTRTEAILQDGLIVSSTQIRKYLESGEIEHANRFLGWEYAVSGTVVRGDARGKALGFPTANLRADAEVIPCEGVYATRTRVGERLHPSVTNVGRNPTFHRDAGATPLRVETHLIDYSGDLYGLPIEVAFVGRIRGETRFPGPDALKAQIARDVAAAREILAREASA
ncbi:MAG: bifunctional riboflavin kinase/FAD synthetase [Bdellovibrionota bacterium]